MTYIHQEMANGRWFEFFLSEQLVDDFFGDNQYFSSDKSWQKYFYYFNYAARIDR